MSISKGWKEDGVRLFSGAQYRTRIPESPRWERPLGSSNPICAQSPPHTSPEHCVPHPVIPSTPLGMAILPPPWAGRNHGHKPEHKKFHPSVRKNFFSSMEVAESWKSCLGRAWIIPLWRHSKPTWMPSSVTCSRYLCLGRGLDCMSSRGPFQPQLFWGSETLSLLLSLDLIFH